MRPRPIRPYIYRQTLYFGVRLSDWKFIGGGVALAFLLPLFLNIRVFGFHLSPILAVFCLLTGTAFFNFVRVNHRPHWLEHQILFYWREATGRGQDITRIAGSRHNPEWVIDFDLKKARREKWFFPAKL